ncbi:MAG: hypothetical protein U9Q69_00195 [Nanoarchaeota archaeon]|nr:hypothetical protein [Nanoarchaeota archaeon]
MKISEVLNEMDIKTDTEGKQKVFSIKFISKNGELRYLRKACNTGLNMDMKKHAMRGVLAISEDGRKIGHPIPVKIWNIIEFNNKKISLNG